MTRYRVIDTARGGKPVRFGSGKVQPQQTYFRSREVAQLQAQQLNATVGHVSYDRNRFRVETV